MASNTKKVAASSAHGKRRWLFRLIAALCCALCLLVSWMSIEAALVRVEYAEVYLNDLPEAFDGTRILFVSDLHVGVFGSPGKNAALVNELSELRPDLLLLGGDYSSESLWSIGAKLVGITSLEATKRAEQAGRDQFFMALNRFEAPYGKFGVAGNHDNQMDSLEQAMGLGGVTLLRNNLVRLTKEGQTLTVVGLDDWLTGSRSVNEMVNQLSAKDCVVLLSHNPDVLPVMINHTASDGVWVDLVLAGHTHGGQVTLLGKALTRFSAYGDRYQTGWINESGAWMLVSNGMGTTGVPFRLGAPAQAHLITLRKKGA